jgi:uncharacterized membrane protein
VLGTLACARLTPADLINRVVQEMCADRQTRADVVAAVAAQLFTHIMGNASGEHTSVVGANVARATATHA